MAKMQPQAIISQSRYAADSRESHSGSVITAHAVHAAPRRG